MSLLDNFKAPCVLLEKKRTSDGEGGFITTWTETAEFEAAITLDTSTEARVAEKQGVTNLYTVTTDYSAVLEFHDVFKRLSDGKIFRATSDGHEKHTPSAASFQFSQVSAEEWTLS